MTDPDLVGRAGDPSSGPFMLLFFKIEDRRIVKASFQTYGCAPAIAAGSLVTEKLTGATRDEALRWDEGTIAAALGGLPMQKMNCATIAATAVRSALDAWK